MRVVTQDELVLAVYGTSKGFAFVLFEGPESPFDWGVREIPGIARNARTVEAIEQLVDQYQPGVMVVEDTGDRLSRRTARIRRLYRSIAHLAATQAIDVGRYTKTDVRRTFAHVGASTKRDIALAIARQIPAFSARIPRVRKPWMSQDSRQSLFDAVALGLTHYAHQIPSPYADG